MRTFLKKNDATLRVSLFVCLHFSFSCPDNRTRIHLAIICKFIMLTSLINKIEYLCEVFIRFHFSNKVWKKTTRQKTKKREELPAKVHFLTTTFSSKLFGFFLSAFDLFVCSFKCQLCVKAKSSSLDSIPNTRLA